MNANRSGNHGRRNNTHSLSNFTAFQNSLISIIDTAYYGISVFYHGIVMCDDAKGRGGDGVGGWWMGGGKEWSERACRKRLRLFVINVDGFSRERKRRKCNGI